MIRSNSGSNTAESLPLPQIPSNSRRRTVQLFYAGSKLVEWKPSSIELNRCRETLPNPVLQSRTTSIIVVLHCLRDLAKDLDNIKLGEECCLADGRTLKLAVVLGQWSREFSAGRDTGASRWVLCTPGTCLHYLWHGNFHLRGLECKGYLSLQEMRLSLSWLGRAAGQQTTLAVVHNGRNSLCNPQP